MSRRALGIAFFVGWLLGGAPACAREKPPASPSRREAALQHSTPGQRRDRRGGDVGGTRTRESRPSEAPPPDARELEAHYGARRALAVLEGEASYYGDSLAGHHTANGERYDPRAYTAAHRSLPFGTILRVVRLDTRAVVYVRVTDRGPFGPARRILDLSRAAAERLNMMRAGVAKVRGEVVEYGPRKRHRR